MSGTWALVTGANGFIGARLVRHLVECGERVKVFVRPGADLTQLRDLPTDQVRLAVGDILAMHTVYRALASCDRLYHVAANYALWARNPAHIIEPAVLGTEAVLEAARRRDLRKIVVTSSAATLGVQREPVPLTEAAEFTLRDPDVYVRAKYEAEQVAFRHAERGLPVVIVNPASVVGPGDWKPTPTGKALLRYLDWPSFARFPVPETGGLSIVDVDDVARGHRLAMQQGRVGERYILGGENVATKSLFTELLPEITGYAPQVRSLSPRLAATLARLMELNARLRGKEPELTRGLVEHHVFNYLFVSSEKAERELGYGHRPAREALTRAVRWYRQHRYISPTSARRIARAA